MRAVLMQHGKLWVDTVEDPIPAKGEVLVRTRACGICGSDLHAAQHNQNFVETSRETGGAFKLTTYEPVVLGHEFCAEVVEFGPATNGSLKPGQLVCSIPVLLRDEPLAVGYSETAPGGFGELMLLSERMILPVPDGTPASAAALTEPMAVGYHAVNKAQLNGEEAIVVVGCGPVGLAIITALKARGAGPVVAADISAGRRRYAEQQGADWVINPADETAVRHASLKGRPLVVFECVGVPGMLDGLFASAPIATRIVVVGVCLQTDHIRPLPAINKELSLQFVLGYTEAEFAESLAFIADGQFDIANLVSHQISMTEVATTFEALRNPDQHAKVIIDPTRL